jgi:hypothetical protein
MKILTGDALTEGVISIHMAGALEYSTVVSGYWSEDRYHGGHIAYQIARTPKGAWVMRSEVRNALLDDVDEEDVRKGRLNDDQLQALWNTTLEEAQNSRYHEVVAIGIGADHDASEDVIADQLLAAVERAGGAMVDEPDE